MKKRLLFFAAFPLLALGSCLETQEPKKLFVAGASEFNQRVADDIRAGDQDTTSRPTRLKFLFKKKP